MKTIDVGAGMPSVEELLNLADAENVILRTRDGREFVLAELDDFDREIALTRQNDELMRLLQERSAEPGRYSTDDIKKEFGLE
jgi:hypothetical protein